MKEATIETNPIEELKNKKVKKKSKKKNKLINYIKDCRKELKMVSWSSKTETLKNTLTVLAVVLISSVLVYGIDTLLSFCIKLILK